MTDRDPTAQDSPDRLDALTQALTAVIQLGEDVVSYDLRTPPEEVVVPAPYRAVFHCPACLLLVFHRARNSRFAVVFTHPPCLFDKEARVLVDVFPPSIFP